MKLRIRGNSVRIRVSQSEMIQITDLGFVEDSVEFAPGQRLDYAGKVITYGEVSASYKESKISVLLPKSSIETWNDPSEISVKGEQQLENGGVLTILIEKDFACLVPRKSEEEADLFPNPRKAK